jgi:hypothetical protein
MRRKRWVGTGIGVLGGCHGKRHEGQTYCTEASLAIRICQGIVGIRVERVHRVRLATNLESDIYLSVARYEPYLAKSFNGFQ